MQKLLVITTLVMMFSLCGPVGVYEYVPPPATFQEADLVGTWQGKYHGVTDTLVITNDGTYQQIAKDSQLGYFYQSDGNKWYIEHRTSDTFRVHFEKMNYYAGGLSPNPTKHGGYVPRSGGSGLYDPVEEVFVTTRNEVILRVVGSENTHDKGNVVLCHMLREPDTVANCFRLVK